MNLKITQKINVTETKKLIDKVSKFKNVTFVFLLHVVFMDLLRLILKQKNKTAPLTEYSKSKVIIEKYLKKKLNQ